MPSSLDTISSPIIVGDKIPISSSSFPPTFIDRIPTNCIIPIFDRITEVITGLDDNKAFNFDYTNTIFSTPKNSLDVEVYSTNFDSSELVV